MKLSFTPFYLLSGAFALSSAPFVFAADDTVFISAKAPISAEEFSGSVSVVTAEQIKARGATSVSEALELLPGVSVSATSNNNGSEIRIRGLDAEFGLVLVDGKRVPNSERNISSSPANRNRWVAIENIERIEVIRGAASSLYGAEGLSGVINIITKKATKEWNSSVTLTGRGFKRSGGEGSGVNLSTSGALSERVVAKLSVDHQDDNGIDFEDEENELRSQRRVTNTQFGLGVEVNDYSDLDFGVIYDEENAKGSDGELIQIKRLFSVDYTTKIGEFNALFSLSSGDTDITDISSFSEAEWRIRDNNVSLDIDGALTDSHYISAGIGYHTEEADRFDQEFSDEFKSTNGFVQDIIDLNDSHSLTVGASFENHNKYGTEISPKIYWNWNIDPKWSVKAGYSEGRVSPAIREGSSEYIISAGPFRQYQGNDDLEPTDSKTVEISAAYTGEKLSSTVSIFSTDIDNLITVEDVSSTLALYSNVNKARINGLEASIGWDINEKSNVSFNYTYLDAENRSGDDKGNRLQERSRHEASLIYDQHVTSIDSHLSIAWKGLSSQYTNSANTAEIRGYGVVDVGLVKNIGDNLTLSAAIKNIGDNRVMDDDEAIAIGREYRLSLTGRF